MLILKGHNGPVRSVCYAAGGRLASGGDDATVRLWDLSTGQAIAKLKAKAGVEALSFQPDGKGFVLGTSDGDLFLRRGARWSQKAKAEEAHSDGVRGLAHAGDDWLLSCGWDGRLLLWNGGALAASVEVYNGKALTALAVSADGTAVATAVSGVAVEVFALPSRNEILKAPAGATVFALAFAPDGQWLATANSKGEIRLWNLRAAAAPRLLSGHTWTVYGLAFTPDGTTLVSGGADGTVRLWDVASGTERQSYRWFSSWVTCLAVAPDGQTAAAGSDDHTLVVWDL